MKQTEIRRAGFARKTYIKQPGDEPKEQNKKCPICKNMYFAHSSFKSACSKECESAHKKLQVNKVKLADGKKLRAVRKLKSSKPVMTPIRKAAKGQDCTLNYPCCNHNPETTVLCHSNSLSDGKGMGLKAPDTKAAFGCCVCHDLLDGRAPMPDGFTREMMIDGFYNGVTRTHEVLKRMGLL